MLNVLFVCLGNICRSPTAEGVFKKLVNDAGLSGKVYIDSAGTADWRIGEHPDQRAIQSAKRLGYDLSHLIARQINQKDFEKFDYIVALDIHNYDDIYEICPPPFRFKLHLLLDYVPDAHSKNVPDPYYGGGDDFERVLDLIELGAAALLKDIKQQHILP